MKNRILNKKVPLKVTYHYIKPKNEEEAKEQARVVNKIYDDLFEAVLEKRKEEKEHNITNTEDKKLN